MKKNWFFGKVGFLTILTVFCIVFPLNLFGQKTTTANEMTITSISIIDLGDFSKSKVICKDSDKELVIETIKYGFEPSISVKSIDIDENVIKNRESKPILIAKVEYDGKQFTAKLEAGIKLKYELRNGKPVILFDASYFVPFGESKAEKPAGFEAAQYTNVTMKDVTAGLKAKFGNTTKFKATVYHIEMPAMAKGMFNADYFFSDEPKGPSAKLLPFKSDKKWEWMKDGQKVIIYFNTIATGGTNIEYIEAAD